VTWQSLHWPLPCPKGTAASAWLVPGIAIFALVTAGRLCCVGRTDTQDCTK